MCPDAPESIGTGGSDVAGSPALDGFERQLSDLIATQVHTASHGGYNWRSADELISAQGIPNTGRTHLSRFKRAGSSSRIANVIKESPQMDASVYFIVLTDAYSLESAQRVVDRDMRDSPRQVEATAFVEEGVGDWRVRAAIAIRDGDVVDWLRRSFSSLTDVRILNPGRRAASGRATPTLEALTNLRREVMSAAIERQIDLDQATIVDFLATMFACQLILVAGPSGTGKSFASRFFQEVLTPRGSSAVLEARRQWGTPEDILGFHSSITGRFVPGPFTADLLRIGYPDPLVGNDLPPTPVVLIEEANLSTIEGYLVQVVHGLSSPVAMDVEIQFRADVVETDTVETVGEITGSTIPTSMWLTPYPRFIGTINIDASAQPPARKVVARSAVILMGVGTTPMTEALMDALQRDVESSGEASDDNWMLLQSPSAILATVDSEIGSQCMARFGSIVSALDLTARVSIRDNIKALLYMLWFVSLCGKDLEAGVTPLEIQQIAAENALLHFILPLLSASEFELCVRNLSVDVSLSDKAHLKIGGLLRDRIALLTKSLETTDAFAGVMDFWNSLS